MTRSVLMMVQQQLKRLLILCLMAMLFSALSGCGAVRKSQFANTIPKKFPDPYWSEQPLTPDRSVILVEVVGTHEEIGYLLGQWYREQGHLPQDLTPSEKETADAMMAFYHDVAPDLVKQLRGVYAAYNLNPDDVSAGIPVWDEDGIRILLPGLAEYHSCSVIATRPLMATDGHTRFGRNHDWPKKLRDIFLVFTAPDEGYPTVVMTRGLPGFTASDGMNGEGLAMGLASVRNVGYEFLEGPALVSTAAYRLVLEQSANVEEAIAMLQRIPVTFINPSPDEAITHILLADRSGASAVVEFLPEGIVISQTDTPYQVMTNSHWAGPADQPDCQRYQTAVEGLEKLHGIVDGDAVMEVLTSIQSSTQWTVVYDLEELNLELALPGDGTFQRYRLSFADFIARTDARE